MKKIKNLCILMLFVIFSGTLYTGCGTNGEPIVAESPISKGNNAAEKEDNENPEDGEPIVAEGPISEENSEIEDLPYTILEDNEIPQEFLDIIEEKKEQPFKLTYSETNEDIYIAVGYGQQSEGYSISVSKFQNTPNEIYFGTTLTKPSNGEPINEIQPYPYLVIKTKYQGQSVVFE